MIGAMQPTQAGDPAAEIPSLTPADLAPHFPQLEILECLGRGGMGVVYKARQKSLNRLVALKLLAPERADDPAFAERFEKEAKALAALSHPNIVTIHDFGQAGGFFYLLMEFVDGVNLRQAMAAGHFTPEQALAIVPPVCEALQYAHEHGIVHRDIKPENLLLDKEGRVKIADFGIAKILGAESSGVGMSESQPAGTPQYMAPEQKEHRVTDHRADIYSLGVVLYEMLTGELPADTLQAPSKRVQVDVRIDEIVLRALEAKPEMRYQTAIDFRTEVEKVKSASDVAQTAAPASVSGFQFRLVEEREGRRVIVWRCVLAAAFAVFAIALIVGAASSLVTKGAPPLLIIVALAGIAALLTLARSVRISLKPGTPLHSEPDNTTTQPRFSRAAIGGACVAAMGLLSLLLSFFVDRIITGAAMANSEGLADNTASSAAFALIGAAFLYGFFATLLGWIAVSQIHRSRGRIHGLWLAVFDGLLFPLMALSAVVAVAGVSTTKMFVDFYANPSVVGDPHIHPPLVTRMANWLSLNNEVAAFVGVIAAIVVNALIVRAVLRVVRREVASSPPESSATGNEIQVASISIILALIAAALGALAAIRIAGAWPAMALSLLFAGMAIIMALPVRRLGVGKCALIIAALGTVIWPLLEVAVSHWRVLPAASARASSYDTPSFAAQADTLISRPESTRQPMAEPYGFPNTGGLGDFLPWPMVFGIVLLGGIVSLVVLKRKGVAADRIALWVVGLMALLFCVTAILLMGWRASMERQENNGSEFTTSRAVGAGTFGPVRERVVHHPEDSSNDYCLDLDSGSFVEAPKDIFSMLASRFGKVTTLGRRDETIKTWMMDSGGDLVLAFTSPDVTLSLYGGAVVFPTLAFEAADAREVARMADDALQQRNEDGKAMPPLTMFHRHPLDLDGAFVFLTHVGGIGILQIVSSTENPRSVKIRYKLLNRGIRGTAAIETEVGSSPSAAPKPLAETTDSVYVRTGLPVVAMKWPTPPSWGEAKDGLQVGMRVNGDAHIGGDVKVELWVCNSSARDIRFRQCGRTDVGLQVAAKDGSGKEHEAEMAGSEDIPVWQRIQLPPGHLLKVKEFVLRFDVEANTTPQAQTADFHLPPGDYQLSARWSDSHPLVGNEGAHESDWSGELASGEVDVTLAAGTAGLLDSNDNKIKVK